MATFLQVGDHWINFDRVNHVQVFLSPDGTKLLSVQVHFPRGETQSYTGAEAQALADWLRKNKAN